MTQKGVRLGLTEKDELEYYMYTGKGEITGQIATFEVFGNNSETRGPRRVYRPLETFDVMTDDQVKEQDQPCPRLVMARAAPPAWRVQERTSRICRQEAAA
jgi:hypothetical protein